jgi:hypothetical protein
MLEEGQGGKAFENGSVGSVKEKRKSKREGR